MQLTAEPAGAADPVFIDDGRIAYVRATGIDELTEEIAVVEVPGDGVATDESGAGDR